MSRSTQARLLRQTRRIHRWTGIALFLFFIVIGITSVLLGWKKNSGGYLLAATSTGSQMNAANWLSLDSLQRLAVTYRINKGHTASNIDRIDIRPDKGIAKVLFKDSYDALQLDMATGQVLLEEKRRADFIEHLHDGSIVDELLGLKSGAFKLIYTTITGLALLTFSLTGFWLWYGPRRMRHSS
ncbi:PepSY-associated TM helix domain-containing protein [Flavihumibacter sp.]|uniref:PepSY-associated TM helix domain-containing protein n=1 Tax=Flavihumibacter sp. TaxID=1913981 RepID=UPI002FCAC997